MALFKRFRRKTAAYRLIEEKLYEQVVLELSNGQRRDGLWAKALANSGGNEEKTKSLYIRYRVQSMEDESEILEAIADEQTSNAKRISTKDPAYVICSACKFEQWAGYDKCQKCGVLLSS